MRMREAFMALNSNILDVEKY